MMEARAKVWEEAADYMLTCVDGGACFSESYADGYASACCEGADDFRQRAATIRAEAQG